MPLTRVKQEAKEIASYCLIEPWSDTEKRVLERLQEWQIAFNSASSTLSDSAIESLSREISITLSGISIAMQQKNVAKLSHVLSEFSKEDRKKQ